MSLRGVFSALNPLNWFRRKTAGPAPSSASTSTSAPVVSHPPPQPAVDVVKAVPDQHIGAGLVHTKAAQVFSAPTFKTSTTLHFLMPENEGREIRPGEQWSFEIPPEYRHTPIRTVILAHRKDEKYAASFVNGRDQQGAYNTVSARTVEHPQKWLTWSDQYGSRKFAERRSSYDPENENLHDWQACIGEHCVDLVRVENVGMGKNAIANVHFVEIEFFPPKGDLTIEEIFTPGTQFVDLSKGIKKPIFGGGQAGRLTSEQIQKDGLYPNAIEIGSFGAATETTSERTYVDLTGNLHIKLPPGKVLLGFELACGDTAFDRERPIQEQRNKDGHIGELGWAKIYASLQNSSDRAEWAAPTKEFLLHKVNVPPAGVLSGGPRERGYVTKPGDELVVESRGHETWVMGYRVQLASPNKD